MQEEWRPVVGYEGLYEISNLGRVKSLKGWNGKEYVSREKFLKSHISASTPNYSRKVVDLKKNGKRRTFRVHRLIAMAFIPNPDNLPEINHKDSNPLNNAISNLEWCTHKYNHDYRSTNGAYAISEETLNAMFTMYDQGTPIKHIAEKLGIGYVRTRKIIRAKRQTKPGWVYREKYHISKEELKKMFDDGMDNQQIAEYYHCPASLIERRKYQYRKGEY